MKRQLLITSALGIFLAAQGVQADWSPPKRLTWTSGASASPAMAIDSANTIHLVWQDYTCGSFEICYKHSKDGGTTWSAAKRLSWNSGWSGYAALAIDPGDTLHVVWEDNTPGKSDIYYKRSPDGGSAWGPTQRLTWNSGWSSMPAMATDSDGHIHVFWHDDTPGNTEIYYVRSSDGGSSWSMAKRLTWTPEYSGMTAVAKDSNHHIHLVWHDFTPDYYYAEIYSGRSTDGGATWRPAQRLTWTSGNSVAAAIAIDSSGKISITYDDDTLGNSEVYYKRSTNGGATWSSAKRLTWTSEQSAFSALAIDSTNALHVIWRDHTPGNYELYYRRGAAGGTTWDAPQRLTWNSGSSMNPAIAIDSGDAIHVVWDDDTPGNYEIYYRSSK